MKNKLNIFILFICLNSYCQSSIEKRDPVNQNDFETSLTRNNSTVRISKYKTSTINETKLTLKTEAETCQETKGVFLILSNGEHLNFANSKISCSNSDNNKHFLTGSILLTPDLYKKLLQTEIKEFTLGKVKVPVEFKEKGENLRELLKFSEKK